MISNEFAVKLCLEHEVENGNKVVKKELIVALRGEIYFVKFIINPEEDDIKQGVVLGRSFMRLKKGIVDFRNKIITIYPDLDPFNDDSDKTNDSGDDWDAILEDGELELEEVEANEEMVRAYKAIKEKMIPKLDREQVKPVFHNVSMLNHSEAEPMWMLKDVLCLVGINTVLAKFLVLDMPVDRTVPIIVGRIFLHTCRGIINTLKGTTSTFDGVCHQKFYVAKIQNDGEESDNNDEEEYYLKRDEMGRPFYGPNLMSYFDRNDPMERALAIQDSINPFQKICVWKKAVAFLGSLPTPLLHADWVPKGFGDFVKEIGDGKRHKKIRVTDPYGNTFEQLEHTMTKLVLPDPNDPDNTKSFEQYGCAKEIEEMLEIKVYEVGRQEEIFSSEAWRRVFNINEPIYTKLCHEFYSTYEFDEVVTDDELMTKKLIKFKLAGRGHTLTLLEFARRLSLYHYDEINEEGFEVYFQRGLRSDENFNARDCWLSISSEEDLHFSRSLALTIRSPIMRVLQKMITYGLCQRTTGYDKMQRNELWLMSMFEVRHQNGYANVAWLMARWLKLKGVGSQRDIKICCGKLITKLTKKMGLLTDEVLNSLSAPTYCKALDATTLRELIGPNRKLIAEDPTPGVPRVAMPRGPHPYMQDLYDRMVFEYMVGQHGIPMQGAYAPLGYDEEQQED
ncbi:hypothetical protein Tco_0447821 [Tanacetum coccineum]